MEFDTRPDAQPDGQWTLYIQGNELERPHWLAANEVMREDDLAVVLPDGSRKGEKPGERGVGQPKPKGYRPGRKSQSRRQKPGRG